MWRFAFLAFIAVVASACGSTVATTTTSTAPSVSIPIGWKTYSYGKAKISVPPSWTIASQGGCANGSAAGVLALGAPKSLRNCPEGANSIVVSGLSSGDAQGLSLCPAVRMNELTVHILPCGASSDRGIVQYLVPSLGIEAVGTGSSSENVTGTGTNTVVGRALHTLR